MSNMKNKTAKLLKQIIAGLTSMAKSKSIALKSKTNAIKARLIIFSLMKNKKFLMTSLSEKFNSVFGHNSHQPNEDCLLEEGNASGDQNNRAIVLYNNNARTYQALQNPTRQEQNVYDSVYGYGYGYGYGGDGDGDDDDDKYPDLTHSLFDSEGLDFDGSVIDKVKNSKEEAGKEFKLEDDIDEVADLFIRKFHRHIILQKQESLKRKREISSSSST